MLRGEEYIERIVENMDYLNRGKEFKYIDVREGRKGIDTGKKQTNGTPVTDKHTNIHSTFVTGRVERQTTRIFGKLRY